MGCCHNSNSDLSRASEAVSDFLTHLRSCGRAISTLQTYSRDLAELISAVGDLPLSEITDSVLDRAVVRLREASSTGRARSVLTMNRIKSAFKSFFGWCTSTGRVARNPSASLKLATATPRHTFGIALAEAEAILSEIRNSGAAMALRDEALLATYAFTGIRRAEALALRAADYDSAQGLLMLRNSKGGRARTLIISNRLNDILGCYVAHLRKTMCLGSETFLFTGRASVRPLSVRRAQSLFEHWKRAAGVNSDVTIHSFRVGFATRLHTVCGDLLLVSRALGHSDIRSTAHYVWADEAALRQAIEQANAR